MPSFVNTEIIEEESITVCKADIIRYEVVYKYGGLYSDIDSLSVKPLGEVFLHSFVAITAMGSPHYIQNCIFGFPAGSNFLYNVLSSVKIHQKQVIIRNLDGIPYKYGPIFFTSVFVSNKAAMGCLVSSQVRFEKLLMGLRFKNVSRIVKRYLNGEIHAIIG